ncbi:MAG: ATP-dependent protease ATPase subunit HslU [Chloroflexi bacterium]|nr:ATP-dependent protease ATPase subunit HslU [Chloroflexota bacterium]OJV89957.1 MAG: HslU--HslV peptidase ATPase subunit [Chloroflexi bacterium 54-19]
MANLTPAQIVAELDKFIVGQKEAKRAVAIALRNRYRRQQLSEEMRDEIAPKNIMMIGPTGVGKTEIARRMAKLIDAPFLKVEATKFTEVGYVGRDVDSILRDLVEVSISMVHDEKLREVRPQAEGAATEKLIGYLVQQLYYQDQAKKPRSRHFQIIEVGSPSLPVDLNGRTEVIEAKEAEPDEVESNGAEDKPVMTPEEAQLLQRRRRRVAAMLRQNKLEETTVEIDLDEEPFNGMVEFMAGLNTDENGDNLQDFMDNLGSLTRHRSRRVSVKEARRILINEEANKLIDFDGVVDASIQRTEQLGVVFLDEIDKIVGNGNENGPDVSGEGVQRDLLPIVEGSTVMTRYGPVKSDHILFIAAGAFHNAKPADLIPELQGRFPLRVELESLEQDDLKEILTKPENALTKQYIALLGTEKVTLKFEESGLDEMARIAAEVNERTEDIGARRLHTIMENVLEEISFDATDHVGETFVIDKKYVLDKVGDLVEDEDLSRYIL